MSNYMAFEQYEKAATEMGTTAWVVTEGSFEQSPGTKDSVTALAQNLLRIVMDTD
jgi:hypothetical protein